MPTRATTPPVRSRRRPVRAVERVHHEQSRPTMSSQILRLASTRAARTAFAVIGTAGLAALAVAIVGPRRIEREVIKPLRGAIEPRAEKLWAEARPLRDQIAQLFQSAPLTGRARLIKNFQSWIGHFHAT